MDGQMWFDGACSGNPGPMGAGAVLVVAGKTHVVSKPLGRGTNNEAEYGGLIAGLEAALAKGVANIVVRGDSQLVIRQLEGRYQVKAANLRPSFERAKALLAEFADVQLQWIAREQNAAADEAARQALSQR